MELEYSLLLKLEENVVFVRRLDTPEQIAHFFPPKTGILSYFIFILSKILIFKYIYMIPVDQ